MLSGNWISLSVSSLKQLMSHRSGLCTPAIDFSMASLQSSLYFGISSRDHSYSTYPYARKDILYFQPLPPFHIGYQGKIWPPQCICSIRMYPQETELPWKKFCHTHCIIMAAISYSWIYGYLNATRTCLEYKLNLLISCQYAQINNKLRSTIWCFITSILLISKLF